MISSSFPIDSGHCLVADASVVINLNATERATDIIKALPNTLFVTENAFGELKTGLRNGHNDAEKLRALIDSGVVRVAALGTASDIIYDSLIEGAAERTLDDGEAATIAYAYHCNGIAVIDERKARSICASRFPKLAILSSVDLLLHKSVERELGRDGQIEAIVAALRCARMRVPQENMDDLVALIGHERAASCNSLPKAARGETKTG